MTEPQLVWSVKCKCKKWSGKFPSFEVPESCPKCGEIWLQIVFVEGAQERISEEY
jgi:Zn finger protein HypA/HybF involved in hydrogenase expression